MNPMRRQLNILEFAISSLIRRKMKCISLITLYTIIIALVASLLFFVQALKREAALLLDDAPDIVVQNLMAGRHELISATSAAKIANIPGVSEVTPRKWGYYFDPVFKTNYTIIANDNLIENGMATIGQGVAKNQRINAGDMFTMRTYSGLPLLLTIKNVLPLTSELLASDTIVMSVDDFITLFAFPRDKATDLAVTVANKKELVTIANKIVEMFPESRPVVKSEILRSYDSIFDWRGGMMTIVLLVAVLSFSIFAWDKAAGLSAEERRETGILKSIGWETSDILTLKFWEGWAVSFTAFTVGICAAYIHVFFLSAPLFAPALKGWSVIYPQFRLTPYVDLYQIMTLFLLTVMPYTVATIVPSWLAATMDADSAMRS